MLWRDTNGKLIVDASGRPIDCATCPCAGASPYQCPVNCNDCADTYGITVEGGSGGCCLCDFSWTDADLNSQTMCDYAYVDYVIVAGCSGAEIGEIDITTYCDEATNSWVIHVEIDYLLGGGGCSVGTDVWEGSLPATPTSCGTGVYTLTWQSGIGNCTMDLTATVTAS